MQESAVPLAIARWLTDDWVGRLFAEAGMSTAAITTADPELRITELGSRMLHIATMSPHRPSTAVTLEVMTYLLASKGASLNTPDDYGRTPATLFLTHGGYSWRGDPEFGFETLKLFIEYGADFNLHFTPEFPGTAGCEKWTLAHSLNDNESRGQFVPSKMMQLLEPHLDRDLSDSAGRDAHALQTRLLI